MPFRRSVTPSVTVFLELHRKNRQLEAQAEQLRQRLAGDRPPSEDRLGKVAEQLARTGVLLRAAEDAEAEELADRIAELERTVEGLREGGG
ncbi:hypothetical protein [Streptomyces sp. NPDC005336]|uniref:hypothetical protein n=1 Tax=unclassified Streptomyces TaxID=2593676 RepID=UPI0033A4D80F